MIRKTLLVVTILGAVLIAVGYTLYSRNLAPAVPVLSAAEASTTGKPYVVKLHAQWCPVCMVTKGVWSQIEETYSQRVNLVVLDFTNEANTEASRAEATRLGLEKFFDEYSGATGTIVVLDGRTKEAMAAINGSRDFAEYRAAIDAALARIEAVSPWMAERTFRAASQEPELLAAVPGKRVTVTLEDAVSGAPAYRLAARKRRLRALGVNT